MLEIFKLYIKLMKVSSCTAMLHYIIGHAVVNPGHCSWLTVDLGGGVTREKKKPSVMLFESIRGHSWCVRRGLISFVFSCIDLICDLVEPVCAWLNHAVRLCQPGYNFMHFSSGCS